MNSSIFAARRENLRKLMHLAKLEALLVTLDANRYYLSGFELHDPQPNESAGCLVIMSNGKDLLCTDSRYQDAAARFWDEEHIFIYRGSAPGQIREMLKPLMRTEVGFDSRHISLAFYEEFSDGLAVCAANDLVEELRLIKEDAEIEAIAASCAINHQLMEWLPNNLIPGETEAQTAWKIEQFFRNNGAEGLAFASIVAVGANAALPHAIPDGTVITDNCAVLVDVGCRAAAYCSDQTRTFWVGTTPPEAFTRNLALVQGAQRQAIACIRPGVSTEVVYGAAKKYLDAQGVGQYFTHGLGHGVGLQTHEAPSLGPYRPVLLKPGMIVTVEPGVYFSGSLGIRWEYMVAVTEDGARIL